MSDELPTLSEQQSTELHRDNAVVKDGEYQLSYNDDREGYYYLRMQGEVHNWSYSFKRVDRVGVCTYNLADKQRAGLYIEDIEAYSCLHKALNTIAQTTPNKAPKDRQ